MGCSRYSLHTAQETDRQLLNSCLCYLTSLKTTNMISASASLETGNDYLSIFRTSP